GPEPTPTPVPAPTPTPGPTPIPRAPTISRMKLAPSSFAAAPSGPSAVSAKRRFGTKVSFALERPASVGFTVVGLRPGRKASGKCVSPTASNRKARACTRAVAVAGSFTRAGKSGTNSFRFTGRLAGHRLDPGRYRLVATPTADATTGRAASAS